MGPKISVAQIQITIRIGSKKTIKHFLKWIFGPPIIEGNIVMVHPNVLWDMGG